MSYSAQFPGIKYGLESADDQAQSDDEFDEDFMRNVQNKEFSLQNALKSMETNNQLNLNNISPQEMIQSVTHTI